MRKKRTRVESDPGPLTTSHVVRSGAGDETLRRRVAGLIRQQMRRNRRPVGGRAGNRGSRHRHVLRRGKALRRAAAGEVLPGAVDGVAFLVRGEVAEVSIHRRDVSLLLGVRELRNRDRGKNADDDDHDEKLDQCETLLVAYHLWNLPERTLSCPTVRRTMGPRKRQRGSEKPPPLPP